MTAAVGRAFAFALDARLAKSINHTQRRHRTPREASEGVLLTEEAEEIDELDGMRMHWLSLAECVVSITICISVVGTTARYQYLMKKVRTDGQGCRE